MWNVCLHFQGNWACVRNVLWLHRLPQLPQTAQVFTSQQNCRINKEYRLLWMSLTPLRLFNKWVGVGVCVLEVHFMQYGSLSVPVVVCVCAVWWITSVLHVSAVCTWRLCTFGLPGLVFVQCGRGWGGRSIGNKWIQINMKLGREGETERKREGCCTTEEEEEEEVGKGEIEVCYQQQRTNSTLEKDHQFLQHNPPAPWGSHWRLRE